MDRTTATHRSEACAQQMADRMMHLVRTLSEWVQAEARPLQEIETQLVRVLHDFGTTLLTSLLPLTAPIRPAPDVVCPACGKDSRYERMRPASVTTLLGKVTVERAIYACSDCGERHAPLDAQWQIAAGGLSLGLQELLALLGATQDSFAQATDVLQRLCLVQVCPNSARAATEDLGKMLAAHEHAVVTHAEECGTAPPAACPAPPRVYVSMDGVLAHTHADDQRTNTRETNAPPAHEQAGNDAERDYGRWRELKVGCIYTTRTRSTAARSETVTIHAEDQSYVVAMTDAETFRWRLWSEACRRGVTDQTEIIIIGDGSSWIWRFAEEHFPHATLILDWYHASSYVWSAAAAIFGEQSDLRLPWARQRLDALWDGQVEDVITALEMHRTKGEGVTNAITYLTNHQDKMKYATYRARGLQVGSGTIESSCKQIVSARLKLAGMIWDADGAEAVAVVRAWLKSNRWQEAMHLRPAPKRSYQRRAAPAGDAAAAA